VIDPPLSETGKGPVPAFAVTVPETGTGVARSSASVIGPTTSFVNWDI
jgi:hypothetical protein